MEISGPAKPSSFLMEMMAIPRISQRNMVKFCTATVCHSCCFPVPLPQPLHPSALGLAMVWVGRTLKITQSCRDGLCPPSHSGTGCSLHPIVLGSARRWGEVGESRPRGGVPSVPLCTGTRSNTGAFLELMCTQEKISP